MTIRNICIALSEAAPSIASFHWALNNACKSGDRVTVVAINNDASTIEKSKKETQDLIGFLADPHHLHLQFQVQVLVATAIPGAAIVDFVAQLKPDVLVVTAFSRFGPEQAKLEAAYCKVNALCEVMVAPVGAAEESQAEAALTKAALKGMIFKPKVTWF